MYIILSIKLYTEVIHSEIKLLFKYKIDKKNMNDKIKKII